MMCVPHYLAKSAIDGFGVFAAAAVPSGALVWRLDPDVDRVLELARVERATGIEAQFFDRYAYYDAKSGAFVLCSDDARFMNHSDEPNVGHVVNNECCALRTIARDEELTCDYRLLDLRPMRFTPRE